MNIIMIKSQKWLLFDIHKNADKMNRNRQRQLPQTVSSEQKPTNYRSTLTARLWYMLVAVVLKFECIISFSGADHPEDG